MLAHDWACLFETAMWPPTLLLLTCMLARLWTTRSSLASAIAVRNSSHLDATWFQACLLSRARKAYMVPKSHSCIQNVLNPMVSVAQGDRMFGPSPVSVLPCPLC
jgi:hypothetical protein